MVNDLSFAMVCPIVLDTTQPRVGWNSKKKKAMLEKVLIKAKPGKSLAIAILLDQEVKKQRRYSHIR
jgi:hypothetical protein